jgi:transcriptional regulator with XRE-family HTH domain
MARRLLTKLGRFLRKIRIDKGELMLDMAEKLGVTPAFLSAVENGKRKPPKEWEERIIALYGLDEDQAIKFHEAFFEALNSEKLDMTSFTQEQQDLMLAFARKLPTMSEKEIMDINQRLERR